MLIATTDPATALRRAAVRATRAPSVHNTQPWRLVQYDHALEIHADWTRRLGVLDPTGRQLLISCGCAVFNARVALAAAGLTVEVERFPDPARPDLVARLTLAAARANPESSRLARLEPAIETRQSNRRAFDDEDVPTAFVDSLVHAADAEGASLMRVQRPEHRTAVARLTQLADRIEVSDPAYRAELRRWTTGEGGRLDGVPSTAVPSVDGSAHDDVPLRDFDTYGAGALPPEARTTANECLLLLGTNADNPAAWARAGEALECVWLEIALSGFTASLFTQLVEVPRTRGELRSELALSMQPHLLLRVGRAAPTSPTRRRRLVDVLGVAAATRP